MTMTVLGICFVMTMIVATMKGVKDMVRQAQNPVYMEQVAQSIAAFPQPLPQGYRYFCALDVVGWLKVLAVDYDHGKRHPQLMFISYMIDNQNPEEHIDATKLVKEVYSHGLNTIRTHSKFANLETEGCWTIQGFMIPYMIGKLSDVKGTGLVACLVNELQKKVVLFYVAQLDDPLQGGVSSTTGVNDSVAQNAGGDKAETPTQTATGDKPAGDTPVDATATDKPADATTAAKPADSSTEKPADGTSGNTTSKDGNSEPFDMHIVTNLLQDVKGF
jgi:hypothetical protein